MESRPPNRSLAAARNALVVAAATALATWQPISRMRDGGWSAAPMLPAYVDQLLDPLRRQSRAGERIGVAIPPGDRTYEGIFICSSQYALAPAVVELILVRECFLPVPGPLCRRETATRVAVIRPDPGTVAALGRRLGLTPVGWVGSVMLLGDAPP